MDTTPFSPEATPPPPPSLPPPPPIILPPPPAKPRRGRGWMIVAIILLVLLVFSLFGNLTQLVLRALPGGRAFGPDSFVSSRDMTPRLDEFYLKNNHAFDKIAVIPVEGVISADSTDPSGNTMVDVFKAQLNRAKSDDRVKAVILKVNSPGGEVMASDQMSRAIIDFQEKSGKPVICSMGSLAASGAYYISAPCRWIQADQLTLTGSIGVIMEGINYRGLMDKVGIAPMVYKSGKYKDMLSGMRETNEIPAGEQAMVQGLINETYGIFTNVVSAGRNSKNKPDGKALASDWMNYADGRVLSGRQAFELGFVDQIGTFDDAVEKARAMANVKRASLVEYRQRYDISNILSLLGQSSQAHEIKLDTGLDLPKLRVGALYFLWQPPGN